MNKKIVSAVIVASIIAFPGYVLVPASNGGLETLRMAREAEFAVSEAAESEGISPRSYVIEVEQQEVTENSGIPVSIYFNPKSSFEKAVLENFSSIDSRSKFVITVRTDYDSEELPDCEMESSFLKIDSIEKTEDGYVIFCGLKEESGEGPEGITLNLVFDGSEVENGFPLNVSCEGIFFLGSDAIRIDKSESDTVTIEVEKETTDAVSDIAHPDYPSEWRDAYKILKENGINDAPAAGILANIMLESGFDSAAVEKVPAEIDIDQFTSDEFSQMCSSHIGDLSYSDEFASIMFGSWNKETDGDESAYRSAGIGLLQWTTIGKDSIENGKPAELWKHCAEAGLDAGSLDGQMSFLVSDIVSGDFDLHEYNAITDPGEAAGYFSRNYLGAQIQLDLASEIRKDIAAEFYDLICEGSGESKDGFVIPERAGFLAKPDFHMDREVFSEGEDSLLHIDGIHLVNAASVDISISSDFSLESVVMPDFSGGEITETEDIKPFKENDFYLSRIHIETDDDELIQDEEAAFVIHGDHVTDPAPVVAMVAVLDKTGNYKYAEKTFYVQVNGINEPETEESEASSETHTDLNDDNHEISTEEIDVEESTVETTESRETVIDGSESAAGLDQTETTEKTGLKTTDASEERTVEQKKGTFKSRIYIYILAIVVGLSAGALTAAIRNKRRK